MQIFLNNLYIDFFYIEKYLSIFVSTLKLRIGWLYFEDNYRPNKIINVFKVKTIILYSLIENFRINAIV